MLIAVMSVPVCGGADLERTLQVPGVGLRRYLLHLPDPPPAGRVPVVLGFHGGTGTAEAFRSLSGLNGTADMRGFAVAYMDAGDGVWGDYRGVTGPPGPDLAYVRAAMDDLVAHFGADAARFYATGLSNGAAFSFVLGAELRDRIAAVAPVAHNLTEAFVTNAEVGGPMHVLQIVGTADPLMPFNGGTQGPGDVVLSSEQTVLFWALVNGNGPATTQPLANPAPDGTTAFRESFAPSPGGFGLARIVVLNGGHIWPGGLQYLPESVIGLTSRDFSANEVIWDFFADKRLDCVGDFDRSGAVNSADLVSLLGRFGGVAPVGLPEDLNRDRRIDTADLVAFLGRFGDDCTP